MTINGKKYYTEFVSKCELCDPRGEDGECQLPDTMECETDEVFKLEE